LGEKLDRFGYDIYSDSPGQASFID